MRYLTINGGLLGVLLPKEKRRQAAAIQSGVKPPQSKAALLIQGGN
jgi:hypothetical protein